MIYDVREFIGVDKMNFGMKKEDVRSYNFGEYRTFDRYSGMGVVGGVHLTDAYEEKGVYCHYDDDGNLEAIDFFSPARPSLRGVDILSLKMSEAIALLKKMDPDLAVDSEAAVSGRLSLGVRRSSEADEDEDAPVDSLFVGRAGYYS